MQNEISVNFSTPSKCYLIIPSKQPHANILPKKGIAND